MPSWSSDGTLLASGSDDTNILIYDAERNFKRIHKLRTGHKANIFSVKFLPQSSNQKLVSCAGDRQVRVYDLESTPMGTHLFKCHSSRVKRIETTGPHTFLSCSEDGSVRQFDLREQHICKEANDGCPKPLVNYAPFQMELHTITLSKQAPHYFVVGGSHQYAFLHDRRMTGRNVLKEWGVASGSSFDVPCVRRFSPYAQQDNLSSVHITACRLSNANPREVTIWKNCSF